MFPKSSFPRGEIYCSLKRASCISTIRTWRNSLLRFVLFDDQRFAASTILDLLTHTADRLRLTTMVQMNPAPHDQNQSKAIWVKVSLAVNSSLALAENDNSFWKLILRALASWATGVHEDLHRTVNPTMATKRLTEL